MEIQGGKADSTVLRLRADATNRGGYNNNRNASRNRIGPINVVGTIGRVYDIGSDTGGVGITANYCAQMYVDLYYQVPAAEGGAIVNNGALSFLIRGHTQDPAKTTGALEIHAENVEYIRSKIRTVSDDGSIDAEIEAENTDPGGIGRLRAMGTTAGDVSVSGRISGNGTTETVNVGSVTNYDVLFDRDSVEIFRITGAGQKIADGKNVLLGTTTGTKFGTATTQKIGFYNATPIVQPSGTGEATGFTAGSGSAVKDDSTFTGNVGSTAYRINDIVKALKNLGLLAS